eukprot:scaffold7763_cov46-Phaeocystis_antarctica.AAC.3
MITSNHIHTPYSLLTTRPTEGVVGGGGGAAHPNPNPDPNPNPNPDQGVAGGGGDATKRDSDRHAAGGDGTN